VKWRREVERDKRGKGVKGSCLRCLWVDERGGRRSRPLASGDDHTTANLTHEQKLGQERERFSVKHDIYFDFFKK